MRQVPNVDTSSAFDPATEGRPHYGSDRQTKASLSRTRRIEKQNRKQPKPDERERKRTRPQTYLHRGTDYGRPRRTKMGISHNC
ncbi:hypothetical protein J6590_059977 [Homalodisca vitripennis]|nr:hypothetical protein J6590_059977 [Homalodisca vitripennis]